jgi:hypothetical protein
VPTYKLKPITLSTPLLEDISFEALLQSIVDAEVVFLTFQHWNIESSSQLLRKTEKGVFPGNIFTAKLL